MNVSKVRASARRSAQDRSFFLRRLRRGLASIVVMAPVIIAVAGCNPVHVPSDYTGDVPVVVDLEIPQTLCAFSMSAPGKEAQQEGSRMGGDGRMYTNTWFGGQYEFHQGWTHEIKVRPGKYVARVEGCYGAYAGQLPVTIEGPTHLVIVGAPGSLSAKPGYKKAALVVNYDMRAIDKQNADAAEEERQRSEADRRAAECGRDNALCGSAGGPCCEGFRCVKEQRMGGSERCKR